MTYLCSKLLSSRLFIYNGNKLHSICYRSLFHCSHTNQVILQDNSCTSRTQPCSLSKPNVAGKGQSSRTVTYVPQRYFFGRSKTADYVFYHRLHVLSNVFNKMVIDKMNEEHPEIFEGEDFVKGSEQALRLVVSMICEGNIEDLKDLVTQKCYSTVEQNYSRLPGLDRGYIRIPEKQELITHIVEPREQKENCLTVYTVSVKRIPEKYAKGVGYTNELRLYYYTVYICRFDRNTKEGEEGSWIMSDIEFEKLHNVVSWDWMLKKQKEMKFF